LSRKLDRTQDRGKRQRLSFRLRIRRACRYLRPPAAPRRLPPDRL